MKKNPFESSRPIWKHVKNGTIPSWLIDRLVSAGHRDPRKEYRTMTIVNVVCSMAALLFLVVVASVLNTTASNRMFNRGIADMIAPAVIVCVCLSVAGGYLYMRKVLENQVLEKTRYLEETLGHLIRAPRPNLTPLDLIDASSLRRAVESALTDLAARKIVFLDYEKKNGESRQRLSGMVNDDLGKLLDVGKDLGVVNPSETFVKFFAQASATRVSHIQREFDKMLAGLKVDEHPPLYW